MAVTPPPVRPVTGLQHPPHCGQSSDSKAVDRVTELAVMLEGKARDGVMPNRFDLERGY